MAIRAPANKNGEQINNEVEDDTLVLFYISIKKRRKKLFAFCLYSLLSVMGKSCQNCGQLSTAGWSCQSCRQMIKDVKAVDRR